MPLAPGTRLGPYEFTAQLGAAAWARSIVAVSLRLGRPVALFDLDTTTSSGDPVTYEVGSNIGVDHDVMPDGRFVMARVPDRQFSREIVLLRNWRGGQPPGAPTK